MNCNRLSHIFFSLLAVFFLKAHAQVNTDALTDADELEKLAAYQLTLNDFNYSEKLLQRAFLIRKKHLAEKHPSSVRTLVELARVNISTFKPQQAKDNVEKVLALIQANPKGYEPVLHVKALFVKALVFQKTNDFLRANAVYEQYHTMVQQDQSLQTTEFHISCLIETSRNYSNLLEFGLNRQWLSKAFQYAEKAYKLSSHAPHKDTPIRLRSIFNLSRLYYLSSNPEESYKYSIEGQKAVNKLLEGLEDPKEKVKLEKYLALFVFQENLSKYYLQDKGRDETFLKEILFNLEQTVEILERNKSIINDQKDVILIVEDYFKVIFRFMDLICVSLYEKTNNDYYLNKLIKYHESGVYHTIRSRLILKNVDFENIPDSVRNRENSFRTRTDSLLNTYTNVSKLHAIEYEQKIFLNSLKQKYPEYYSLKYGPFVRELENINDKIPEDTTVIRYFYILERLYAIVIDSSEKTLITLPYINIPLYQNEMLKIQEASSLAPILKELYEKLWRPLENTIKNEKVIIIPERNLFNISFETLTFSSISSLNEMASKSLLTKYDISYNYSLFLVDKNKPPTFYNNDYIGFVPEFNDQMKENYKIAISDSVEVDKSYLTLLPQPWVVNLANKTTRLFNGKAFINEQATKRVFVNNANEHKIIHIGTHAEANNTNPELSRLVFAKNILDSLNVDDNYLFTYEIYDQNLSSNLAILTACETGKPSYQPGEGMISLAHAFNYAGSESVLTSLWKVDEQSSALIMETFYDYLADGLPKDKALRQAKLDYISKAEGRTASPQYWAGLVLIGDASPIDISTPINRWLWVVTIFLLLGLSLFFLKKGKLL